MATFVLETKPQDLLYSILDLLPFSKELHYEDRVHEFPSTVYVLGTMCRTLWLLCLWCSSVHENSNNIMLSIFKRDPTASLS